MLNCPLDIYLLLLLPLPAEKYRKPVPPFSLPESRWELIQKKIRDQQCVLLIGPELLPHPVHGTIEKALHHYLLEKNGELAQEFAKGTPNADPPFIHKFYQDDKFFLLQSDNKDQSHFSFMKYYQQFFVDHADDFAEARAVLEKLAQLPFHIIISLTTDNLLTEAYTGKYGHHIDVYRKNQPPEPYIPGTAANPLLYYMRGHIKHQESMVITHNDLFDYLQSIFSESSMHPDMKDDLDDREKPREHKNLYIFLGLPLEEWYMQLLLRLFNMHIVNPQIIALKKFEKDKQAIQDVYEDLYKIEFHPNEGQEFIEQLHQRFADQGALKEETPQLANDGFSLDKLRYENAVREGDTEETLKVFKEIAHKYAVPKADHQAFFDDLSAGEGNYNRAKRQFLTGRSTKEEWKIDQNRLVDLLGILLDDLTQIANG